jgi:hypothetical protein
MDHGGIETSAMLYGTGTLSSLAIAPLTRSDLNMQAEGDYESATTNQPAIFLDLIVAA